MSAKSKIMAIAGEYGYNPIGSFRMGNPYTIAFCYCDKTFYSSNEFVLKGGVIDVDKKILKLGFPMLVFKTYWCHGRSRGGAWPSFENFKNWSLTSKSPYFSPHDLRRDPKTRKSYYRRWKLSYNGDTMFTFRRIPRKWLPEYSQLLFK